MLIVRCFVNDEPVSTLACRNDGSGTEGVGNYDCRLWHLNPEPGLPWLLAAGRRPFRVEGFDRSRGHLELVHEALAVWKRTR